MYGVGHLTQFYRSWSLAEDEKLLDYLKDLSRSVLQKLEDKHSKIYKIVDEVNAVSVRFDNSCNRFVTLSRSQFIENRVYEDEDCARMKTEDNIQMEKKTISNKESEMLANITEAVLNGCQLIDTHFKKIEIRPQDFDEDDDPTFRPDPIFEPFDPFLARPLPHLIGLQDFLQSRYGGVFIEEEEEEEEEERSEVEQESIVINLDEPKSALAVEPPVAVTQSLPVTAPFHSEKASSDHSGLFPESADSGSSYSDDLFAHSTEDMCRVVQSDNDQLATVPYCQSDMEKPKTVADELLVRVNNQSNDSVANSLETVSQSAHSNSGMTKADIDYRILPKTPSGPVIKSKSETRKEDTIEKLFEGIFDSDDESDLFTLPKSSESGLARAAATRVVGGLFGDNSDDEESEQNIIIPPVKSKPVKQQVQSVNSALIRANDRKTAAPKQTLLFEADSDVDNLFNSNASINESCVKPISIDTKTRKPSVRNRSIVENDQCKDYSKENTADKRLDSHDSIVQQEILNNNKAYHSVGDMMKNRPKIPSSSRRGPSRSKTQTEHTTQGVSDKSAEENNAVIGEGVHENDSDALAKNDSSIREKSKYIDRKMIVTDSLDTDDEDIFASVFKTNVEQIVTDESNSCDRVAFQQSHIDDVNCNRVEPSSSNKPKTISKGMVHLTARSLFDGDDDSDSDLDIFK